MRIQGPYIPQEIIKSVKITLLRILFAPYPSPHAAFQELSR